MRNLINIVSETPEQVRSEIDKKIQNIPDESDLTDILKFTNRYSIKKDVDAFTTLRNYKGLVSGVFLQALADAGIGETEVKKFLAKLSTDGILNEKKLINLVLSDYLKYFNFDIFPRYRDCLEIFFDNMRLYRWEFLNLINKNNSWKKNIYNLLFSTFFFFKRRYNVFRYLIYYCKSKKK